MQDISDQIKEEQAAAEALEPSTPVRDLKFNLLGPAGEGIEKTYTQAPLGFFPKQQFIVLMSDQINNFVNGDYGVKLGELFRGDLAGQIAMPTEFTPEAVDSVLDQNMQLIQAFLHLVQIAPELQQDIIALSLGVPRHERDWFKVAITEPPHRGGLTDDEGFDILKVFIRQNAKAIRVFFAEKTRELVDVFREEILPQATDSTVEEEPVAEEQHDATPGGTPSSTSSPDILENV